MSERLCPNCGYPLAPQNEVDIGVGILTGGPWGCDACHYVEPNPLEALGIKLVACTEMQEDEVKIIKERRFPSITEVADTEMSKAREMEKRRLYCEQYMKQDKFPYTVIEKIDAEEGLKYSSLDAIAKLDVKTTEEPSTQPCSACAVEGFCKFEESRDGAPCQYFDPGPGGE